MVNPFICNFPYFRGLLQVAHVKQPFSVGTVDTLEKNLSLSFSESSGIGLVDLAIVLLWLNLEPHRR